MYHSLARPLRPRWLYIAAIHYRVASVEEEANADVLAALTKKTWKVYRVSPLFRFERGKNSAGAAATRNITRHDINNKENKSGNKAANHDDTADHTIVPDPTDIGVITHPI